jgi:hypothetical protein
VRQLPPQRQLAAPPPRTPDARSREDLLRR